jgi:hypothetical protein
MYRHHRHQLMPSVFPIVMSFRLDQWHLPLLLLHHPHQRLPYKKALGLKTLYQFDIHPHPRRHCRYRYYFGHQKRRRQRLGN